MSIFTPNEARLIEEITSNFIDGDVSTGLLLLKKNQQFFNDLPNAYLYIGGIVHDLNPTVSRKLFKSSFCLRPSYESSILLATSLYQKGQYSLSSTYFEKALSFKESALDYHLLARSYHALGLNELAIINFKLSNELFPKFVNHHYHARSLYNIGRYSEALDLFQICMAMDSTHWRTWQGLGRCYFKLSKYADSINCFTKSLEFKQHWRSLKGLAWSHFYLGDSTSAEKYFKLCLSYRSDWSSFMQSSVVALGDWNKKADCLSVIFFGLALVNEKTEFSSKSRTYFEKALYNLPKNEYLFQIWINSKYNELLFSN